jgi:CRP/FNR family transcriptional regulator, dissimilatory nitrate respiration regulator
MLHGASYMPHKEQPEMTTADWLPPKVRAAGTERALKRGEALFRAGQRTVGLYEITSGRVRLVRHDRSGREVVLHNARSGDTIAEASLFSPTYHCDAIATTAARVRLYPKGIILAEFARNPEAAQPFMARLGHQIMALRTLLERHSIRSARERIRHYLALNVGADGRTVTLAGTLKELAADLDLTHEALYRTLARMASDGEIKRMRGAIRLA